MGKQKKTKSIEVPKDMWMKILSLGENNRVDKSLHCKFVSEEKISNKTYDSLWRLTVADISSNELFCIKYVRFINEEGNMDIDINNPYYCKIYKI